MTRWFVGVKPDGRREVFAESTGTDPNAFMRGYTEVCGPYKSASLARKAAHTKPSVDGASWRKRPK